MSTAAVNRYSASSGATARTLPGQAPGTGPARKSRTPLSLVRSAPRKRRAPFVVLCFGLLAFALMVVLVLNISVSSAQYQLVQLRGEQSALTKQNQDLTQQVQNFDAPQNLAAKASELGMVASTVKGQIDLSTLTVTGKAKPAVKSEQAGAVIAAPAVAAQLTVVPPVPADERPASRKPAETVREPAAAAPAPPAAAEGVPAPPAAELNGGSVPAPAQKVPGH